MSLIEVVATQFVSLFSFCALLLLFKPDFHAWLVQNSMSPRTLLPLFDHLSVESRIVDCNDCDDCSGDDVVHLPLGGARWPRSDDPTVFQCDHSLVTDF